MNTVFPGDKLWGRYRVERLIGNGSAGAWLTSVPDSPRGNELTRYLLVPLHEPASGPLAELLDLMRHTLQFEKAAPRPASRKRTARAPRVQRYGRKSLPVLGEVEWIGEQSGDGVAILTAPPAIPISAWLETNGPLAPAQLVPVLMRLARGVEQLTASIELAAPRPAVLERFSRALARLLNPSAVALAADSAQLILRRQAGEPQPDFAPPPHSDFLAPELFCDAVTPAALVFSIARLGAVLAGQKLFAAANAEAGWVHLAEWASGKSDPARDFLATPAAEALPVELRDLLARCLAKTRSRRLPTPEKFATHLKTLAELDWAQQGVLCSACGFVIVGAQTADCPCCGHRHSEADTAAGSAAGATDESNPRVRRRSTTTILKRPPAGAAAVVAAPKIEGMTVIEAGMFLSGEDKTPRSLRAFAIDTMPVTEGAYKKFLIEISKTPREGGPGSREAAFDAHPVVNATWFDANEFAEHYGKRLPTIFEWEKAARGSDGRRFPFGNTFKARYEKKKPATTSVAGSFPSGASPFGVQDMSFNVLQWTSSARRAGDRLFRAVKGSCYLDGSPELSRCAAVQYLSPETSEAYLGFRCVKDID